MGGAVVNGWGADKRMGSLSFAASKKLAQY
jgi:hypothetical protein